MGTRRDLANVWPVDQHDESTDARSMPMRVSRLCRRGVATAVLDLDHTLWDWTRGWASATRAMLQALAAGARVDRGTVLRDLRSSHVRHGTTDCAAALEDLAGAGGWSRRVLETAATAYRRGWQQRTQANPGVVATLHRLRRTGVRLIGFTEAPPRAALGRLALTGLSGAFDMVVCTSHDAACADDRLALAPVSCALPKTRSDAGVRFEIAPWWPKGTSNGLREMLLDQRAEPDACCVVGDHLQKDIEPAMRLGLRTAWARYGTWRCPHDYRLLQQLCHWSEDGRGAQRSLLARAPDTRHVTLSGFSDLLTVFGWTANERRRLVW